MHEYEQCPSHDNERNQPSNKFSFWLANLLIGITFFLLASFSFMEDLVQNMLASIDNWLCKPITDN